MRYSVSPSRTLYSSGPLGSAAAGALLDCTVPRDDGAGRVAGAAACGGIGCRGRRGGRRRRRGRWRCRHLRCDGRGRLHRWRHARLRRIEQQREFAHQAARGPRELEDHVDEGLLHRAIAGHAQIRPAIGAAGDRDLRRRQHGVVVDALRAIGLGRRDAHLQRRLFVGREAGDVDLGTQRLAEGRLNVEATESKGPGVACGSHQCGQRDAAQRDACSMSRAVFQGVSQVQPARLGRARRRSQVMQLERLTSGGG